MQFESLINQYVKELEPIPTLEKTYWNLKQPLEMVVFDIYGTLLISGTGDVGSDYTSANEKELVELILKENGYSVQINENEPLSIRIKSYHKKAKENGITFPEVDILEIWQSILFDHEVSLNSNDDLESIAMQYELMVNAVYPMPGTIELLDFLIKKKVNVGIVSNAQFYTPIILSHLIGKERYDEVFNPDICTFSYTTKEAKPSKKMFQKILNYSVRNDIDPSRIVYIGNDQLKDVYTANQSGLQTILFAGDERSLRKRESHPEASLIKPDAVITSLLQIKDQIHF